MKISILWSDSAVQIWEILKSDTHSIVDYCIRDGCIDFYGRKITSKPLPLVQSEEKRDFIIPLNTVRAIEINKDV